MPKYQHFCWESQVTEHRKVKNLFLQEASQERVGVILPDNVEVFTEALAEALYDIQTEAMTSWRTQ